MAKDDKLKALDAAIAQIERQYGKGSVMKLGDNSANMNVETVPTGSLSLDIALGLGGLPKGRIIEIYGPESSGKTTVALHFRVILDASPATKGHALILPKQHYANMFEMDDEVLAKAAKLAKKVITHEKEVLGCDGYNVLQNNGEAAGQTVFHFHMHLIPRKAGDQAVPEWEHLSLSDDEMKEICDKMKM